MENIQRSSNIYSKLIKGSTYLLIGSLFVGLSQFIFKYIIAIELGPSSLGIIQIIMMCVGLFSIFLSFGIPGSVTKLISETKKNPEENIKIIENSYKLILLFSIVAFFFLLLTADYLSITIFKNEELIVPLQITSIILLFSILGRYYKFLCMGFHNMKQSSILDIINSIMTLIITIILISLGYGVFGPIIGLLFGSITMFLIGIYYNKNLFNIASFKHSIDKGIVNKIIQFSLPYYTALIIEFGFGWSDTFFIGYFLSIEAVGIYSVSLLCISSISLITRPIYTSLFPIISELHSNKDSINLSESFNLVFKYIIYATLPLATILIFYSYNIIEIFFGEEYLSSIPALQILSIGAIFASLKNLGSKYIVGINQPKLLMNIDLFITTIYIGLNILLIPMIGITGAALSFTIALLIMCILIYKFISKSIQIDYNPIIYCIFPIIIISLISYFIIDFITFPIGLIVITLVMMTVFYTCLYLERGFSKKEIALVKSCLHLKGR